MKSLPVYELSQWIKSDRNIGYIVARMSAANVWEVREDYANRKDVERFNGRGAGYVIQWVELEYSTPILLETSEVVGSVPRRLCWLMATTIAEKRYQPCENPVKVPAKYEAFDAPNANDPNDGVTAIGFGADGKAHVIVEPSQPVLPLDIGTARLSPVRAAVLRVTVQSPPIDVTIEQVTAWLLRNGFEALDDRAIDSIGFRHIESSEILLMPKRGCFDPAGRMSLSIETCSGILGVEALTILREMSEVVP